MRLHHLLRTVVSIESVWRALDATVLRPGRALDLARQRVVRDRRIDADQAKMIEALKFICPDMKVKHGLFAGMRFPEAKSTYGALGAKLLGCYERELHDWIEDMRVSRRYSLIVDIGCAEGYYAVGLARLMPETRVQAFDTDPDAVKFCREMALANDVDDRVALSGFCTNESLVELVRREDRALIISDCEGYELRLFTTGAGEALRRHDLIIEVHDFIDITTSSRLREVFEQTHELAIVRSLDDLDKVRTYHEMFPELHQFDLHTRRLLVSEGRRAIQQWLVARSRE